MSILDKIQKKYDYNLPKDLIATKPSTKRDLARLLIYDKKTQKIFFDTFSNLTKYLPQKSVIVFNQTKVIPARFEITKITGGKVRLLYIEKNTKEIKVMSDRKLEIESKIKINNLYQFKVQKQEGKYYFIKPLFNISKIFSVLDKYGQPPIPPYIKNTPLSKSQLKKEYQTVFAKEKGSIAAPTASLHFTKNLINKIKKEGHQIVFITLHVGLGTFSPLTEENLKRKRLHKEWFDISKKSIAILNKAKKQNQPIIAVGTTVVRTLESATNNHQIIKPTGETDLFINEDYNFKFVDKIITNFHIPKSSLMMLVSAFIGRKKLLDLYSLAIKNKFRFFSFGDGMFIK